MLNKEQRKAANQRYYLKTKERMYATRKRSKVRAREFIQKYREEHPCVDCGETNWLVLQFDHLPGFEKFKAVANMSQGGYSVTRIQLEIDKCEVVCANCHTIRTHERRLYASLA